MIEDSITNAEKFLHGTLTIKFSMQVLNCLISVGTCILISRSYTQITQMMKKTDIEMATQSYHFVCHVLLKKNIQK